MPDASIHATGPILEKLGEVLYRAELPNGKPVLAHLSKRLTLAGTQFEPGRMVVLELTPYDFDQARILRVDDDIDPHQSGTADFCTVLPKRFQPRAHGLTSDD